MSYKQYMFKVVISALLIASIVLVNTSVAFADEGVTPDSTPTPEPTEETGVTETPELTQTPDVTVMEGSESTPEVEATPSEDEQVPAEDDTSDLPLFEQLPDDTEIVVLDGNGEPIPLVTQEALDIILDTDPMWCPAGVLPGGVGCSINFATISALLTSMRNSTGSYTQDGIIYFTANPGASFSLTTAGSSLGTGDFNTLNDFNLTLQGGWNGLNGGSATFTGTTNFGSNTLTIGTSSNPWVGNITVNNFSFNNVTSNNAITIYTTSGDITLNNVDVGQQGGTDYTAYLDSQSGDITVQNGSSFDGNNSGANQNRGFHAETNSGAITISDTTFSDAHGCLFVFFGSCFLDWATNYNGATLNAPTVTLTNVVSNNNDLSGISISNANSIWLNNVVSTNNGTIIVGPGVLVNGTGSTVVNVNGGTFSNNDSFGVYVTGSVISVISPATCTGNLFTGFDNCYNIAPLDVTPPVLNLPADITTEATGPSGATVTYSASATDLVDGPVAVTCSPSSGSIFPIGTTTVNCSAADSSGNTANGNFSVTVQDTTPPTLTLPADITTEATGPSGAIVSYSASASDIVDGSVPVICIPASGGTFPIASTTVNCSATDTQGNSANGSFSVIVQDTTPPVISPQADIFIISHHHFGVTLSYTAPGTNDAVDGAGIATCIPSSGSIFPIGNTIVTCTATDSHGNTAVPVMFLVMVDFVPQTTQTSSGGFIITVTGGELIDLDCSTVVNAFGIQVAYHNLCDYQSVITDMEANTLPAELPIGSTFVDALNIAVLFEGAIVEELPLGTGVQLDFPVAVNTQDQYAVLLWDNENKEWLNVTKVMNDSDIATTLSKDSNDELYQIAPTATSSDLYRILTTEKTGTFVIVKK
ncbi:MAG TPA: hypothetical protein DCX53_08345 [Anaerolineae bacterium]|nr:hypothetical protein [Anaerolineae bacterium]